MASVPRIRAIINYVEKFYRLKQTEWEGKRGQQKLSQKQKREQVTEMEKPMNRLTKLIFRISSEEAKEIPLTLNQRLNKLTSSALRLLRFVSSGILAEPPRRVFVRRPAERKIVLEPRASNAMLQKLAQGHEKLVQLGVVSKVARYIIMQAVFSLSNPVKLEDAVAAWQVYMQQAQKVYADAEIKHPKTHARNAPMRAAQFVLDMMRFVVFGTTNWFHEYAEEHVVCPYFYGAPNFIIGLVVSSTLLCRSYSELLYALTEGFPDILPLVDVCLAEGHVVVNIWSSASAWVTRPVLQIESGTPTDSRPHLRIKEKDDYTLKHLVPQNQKLVIIDEGLLECIQKSKGEWNMMASMAYNMTLRERPRFLLHLTNFQYAFGMPEEFGEELADIYTMNCTGESPADNIAFTREIYYELSQKWLEILKQQIRNNLSPSDDVLSIILGAQAFNCWKQKI